MCKRDRKRERKRETKRENEREKGIGSTREGERERGGRGSEIPTHRPNFFYRNDGKSLPKSSNSTGTVIMCNFTDNY